MEQIVKWIMKFEKKHSKYKRIICIMYALIYGLLNLCDFIKEHIIQSHFKISKYVISGFLSLVMIISIMSMSLVSADNGDYLFVDGINILTAENNTINYGDGGFVQYNVANGVLTLTNAYISKSNDYVRPIQEHFAGISGNIDVTIQVVGNNQIKGEGLQRGLYFPNNNVSIVGEGKLNINTALSTEDLVESKQLSQVGISVKQLQIKDTKISICANENRKSDVNIVHDIGIRSTSPIDNNTSVFDSAELSIDGYAEGILFTGDKSTILIKNSNINIKDSQNGIFSTYSNVKSNESSFQIENSKLKINSNFSSIENLNGNIEINQSNLSLTSLERNTIYTEQNISIHKSELDLHSYYCGIQARDCFLNVVNSKINAVSSDDATLFSTKDISIKESNLDLQSQYASIFAKNSHLNIDKSQIKANSQDAAFSATNGINISNNSKIDVQVQTCGFYTESTLKIEDSDVKTKSVADVGLYSQKSMSILNSRIEATSDTKYGILSKDSISISKSNVFAKGTPVAIGVVYTKQDSNEDAQARISIDKYSEEKLNAKISFTDWNANQNITSFVPKDVDKLSDDLSNAQTSVTILIKLADYTAVDNAILMIPSDLNQYTDETVKILNDAKNAVIRDKYLTEQEIVDGYATAIEQAIAKLKYKNADYTKVKDALKKIPADLSAYTDETVKVLNDARNAVKQGKNITEQTIVNNYAIAIEKAIAGLKQKPIIVLQDKKPSQSHESTDEKQISNSKKNKNVITQDSTQLLVLGVITVISGLSINYFKKKENIEIK